MSEPTGIIVKDAMTAKRKMRAVQAASAWVGAAWATAAIAVSYAGLQGVNYISGLQESNIELRLIVLKEIVEPCVESFVKRKVAEDQAAALCWAGAIEAPKRGVAVREMLKIAVVESYGDPWAMSDQHALGYWQVHLKSWSWRWPCLHEPRCNARAAATIYSEDRAALGGDVRLTRMAYNRGRYAVLRDMRAGIDAATNGYHAKVEAVQF